MALEGPIDSKVKEYLKNALNHDLDDMLNQYMNAFFLQQRIVLVTHQFEKNANLTPEIKVVLQNLVTASQQYLDDFNKQSLLSALENALKTLNEQQGYVINFTQNAKVCSEIAQQLMPIKADLSHSVSIESLTESFILIEKSSLLASTMLPPPPPPPAPPVAKSTIAVSPSLKPVPKVPPVPIPQEQDLNRKKLFQRLQSIEKALEHHGAEKPDSSDVPKLSLSIKRELTTVALEAQRRRYKKSLDEVRADPTKAQQDTNSKGLMFLSMLQSEISGRKEKVLRSIAQKSLVPAVAEKSDEVPIEDAMKKLQLGNKL